METVGIDDLKKRLSELIRKVEEGARIVVTRHNRPVAELTGTDLSGLHRGARFGQGSIEPALKEGPGSIYLQILQEDRRGKTE